jgi:glycine C-acetyltransferase
MATPNQTVDKLAFIDEELEALKESGLYINIRTIESAQGAWLVVEGQRVLNFCSNNYLGLANHPHLREAAIQAIEQYGVGPGAVRTIAGNTVLHDQLEKKLAAFKGVEAAIALQSGLNANLAVIPALMTGEDLIISDELNHASIIDGVRLTKSKRAIYKHNDAHDLKRVLDEAADQGYGKILVVTDGVFSMDGDIAPLDEIVEAAESAGALVMVDGGYAAGTARLVEYLRQKSRPFLFSSATTIPDTAACIAAVDLLTESTELVDRLWENARVFKAAMADLGFDTGHSQTPIVPVMLGEATLAQRFSRRLFEEGVFGMAIGYPTVPRGKARIRVMNSATHSEGDLKHAIEVFERVGRELGVIG